MGDDDKLGKIVLVILGVALGISVTVSFNGLTGSTDCNQWKVKEKILYDRPTSQDNVVVESIRYKLQCENGTEIETEPVEKHFPIGSIIEKKWVRTDGN